MGSSIEVDRYLLRVQEELEGENYEAALAALDQVLRLRDEAGLETPDGFWIRDAEVALAAGAYDRAGTSARRYVERTGRDGEHYEAGLRVLNEAAAPCGGGAPGGGSSPSGGSGGGAPVRRRSAWRRKLA